MSILNCAMKGNYIMQMACVRIGVRVTVVCSS